MTAKSTQFLTVDDDNKYFLSPTADRYVLSFIVEKKAHSTSLLVLFIIHESQVGDP